MAKAKLRPRNRVFKVLRDLWLDAEEDRTSVKLGEFLGIRKQKISTFATGSDGYVPPWSALLMLCSSLDRELRISGGGIVIARVSRNDTGGLRVEDDDVVLSLTAADLAGPMPL